MRKSYAHAIAWGLFLCWCVAFLFESLWRHPLVAIGTVLGTVAALVGGILTYQWWRTLRAVARFRNTWGSRGKDLLLVYSNSPHWQRYVEQSWLPRWGHRAVVLNWSDRRQWARRSPEVAIFNVFASAQEYNPLAIVVPLSGPVHVVRFWLAFRDYKHGKDGALLKAEAELDAHLPRRFESSLEASR